MVGRSLREWTTRSTLRERQDTHSGLQRATPRNIWGLSDQRDPSKRRRRGRSQSGGGGHSLVPLQSVLQLFGEQALLPDLHP